MLFPHVPQLRLHFAKENNNICTRNTRNGGPKHTLMHLILKRQFILQLDHVAENAHRNQIAIVIFDNGREARAIMGGYFRRGILIV